MKHARFSLVLLALTSAATLSHPRGAMAGNAIAVGSLQVTAGFNTGQFRLPFTGDDNHNATVLVTYSKGTSFDVNNADTAVVPVRDDVHHRFTGVMLWLEEGTSYAVRCRVTDPNGINAITELTFSTRTPEGHRIPSDPVYVSPDGHDTNPGTLAQPKRTIAGAYTTMLTRGAGSQIRLLPGIYYETAWLQAEGTATNYYSIVGQGDPDSIIVDGSDPQLLNTTWTAYRYSPQGPQVNSIFHVVTANASLVHNVVAGWGQRLHTKQSMDQLVNFSSYPNLPQQGWFRNGDTLFVRLEGGSDPQSTTMHVAIRSHGLRITGNYWRAESLTVRFTGDKGYFLGAWSIPDSFASYAVIRNCRGVSCGQQQVYGNINSNYVLVDSCRFEDGRIDDWTYLASKYHFEENATGLTTVGRGWAIRNCTVLGTSNGIQVTGSIDSLEWGSDAELCYNRITKQADDGIENDGSHGVNQVLWGNVVDRCIHGFSPNPMYTGPIYVLYSVFNSEDSAALKMGGGTTAVCFYYHNVFTSASCFTSISHVGGGYKNQVFRNNVIVGVVDAPRSCFSYAFADGNAGMDTTVTAFGSLLDSDLWWQVAPWASVAWWNGITRDWSYLRNALHWEANGTHLAPTFVDSAASNFRPSAGAAQIDRGVRIPGINTRNKTGSALFLTRPDCGAYEYGLAGLPGSPRLAGGQFDPEAPPMANTAPAALALSPSWPNPTKGATRWHMALPRRARVDARVYDLAGREVATVISGAWLDAGEHVLEWNGRPANGPSARTGVYFLLVRVDGQRMTQRLIRIE